MALTVSPFADLSVELRELQSFGRIEQIGVSSGSRSLSVSSVCISRSWTKYLLMSRSNAHVTCKLCPNNVWRLVLHGLTPALVVTAHKKGSSIACSLCNDIAMTETLLSILLVTSSAKGSSLVYRWPPTPQTVPRLSRPKSRSDSAYLQADNPSRASNSAGTRDHPGGTFEYWLNEEDYLWKRPRARDRSMSYSQSRSRPTSRRASPSPRDVDELDQDESAVDDDYDSLLGYSAKFLAKMLSPQRSMCHQQFGLVVDDLAFIGHPVCADQDGTWHFSAEKSKMPSRGRGSRKGQSPHVEDKPGTPERSERSKSAWLQTFHLVLIHDLPDPSSYSAGNVAKYFDTVYEQVVFPMTAVLFQEQVLYNYVETECDTLGALRESLEG